MANAEKLQEKINTASKGYVQLTELEILFLKDMISDDEKIITAFLGANGDELDGLFVITNKQVIFLARPKTMKDFDFVHHEYSAFYDVAKYTVPNNLYHCIDLYVLDGSMVIIEKLTESQADLLYKMFVDFIGTEANIQKPQRKNPFKQLVVIGAVAVAIFLGVVGIGEIFSDESEPSNHYRSVAVDSPEIEMDERERVQVLASDIHTTDNTVTVDDIISIEYIKHYFADKVMPPNNNPDAFGHRIDEELFTFLVIEANVANLSKKPLDLYDNPLRLTVLWDEVHEYYPMIDFYIEGESDFHFNYQLDGKTKGRTYYMFRIPRKSEFSDGPLVLQIQSIDEDYHMELIKDIDLR